MEDLPDYDIAEVLLAGLFICGALIALIWAGWGLYHQVLSIFLRGAGMALVFLGGMANPKSYVISLIALPYRLFAEKTGRETPITVCAGWLGFVLTCAGTYILRFEH